MEVNDIKEKQILDIELKNEKVHLFPVKNGFVGICENDPRTIIVSTNPKDLEDDSFSLIQTIDDGQKMPVVLTTMSYGLDGISSFPICKWSKNQVPFGFLHHKGYLYSKNKTLCTIDNPKLISENTRLGHINLTNLTNNHVFIPKPNANFSNVHFFIELCSDNRVVVVNEDFIWDSKLGKKTLFKSKLEKINFLDVVKWFTIMDLQCTIISNVFPKFDLYDEELEETVKKFQEQERVEIGKIKWNGYSNDEEEQISEIDSQQPGNQKLGKDN